MHMNMHRETKNVAQCTSVIPNIPKGREMELILNLYEENVTSSDLQGCRCIQLILCKA
jgi:hypothetical protein